MSRIGVLRVPDWPVVVARQTGALPAGVEAGVGAPGAIVHAMRIVACDAAARADGVRVGMRVRDAQAASPLLALAPSDPVGEMLAFERVVRAVLGVLPAAEPIGEGRLAFRMRGPSRFYGSELRALEAIAGALAPLGLALSIGVADDRFTAEVAAASADVGPTIVRAGGSAAMLAGLPVSVLAPGLRPEAAELPSMLHRLGVHTLGDLARLPEGSVRDRFGEAGVEARLRARGEDPRGVEAQDAGEERVLRLAFEPGIEGVGELALAVRDPVDAFVRRLAEQRLVCSELRIVLRGEEGRVSERLWRQPGFLRAPDIVDRMRWQLAESDLGSALVEVQALPERLDRDTEHMPGLWGGGGIDDRTKHALERLQGMLGREAVLTAAPGGGRLLAERGVLTPWGDAPPQTASGPWPGALPPPRPATVFRPPQPVRLVDAAAEAADPAALDDRTGSPPAWFTPPEGGRRRVVAWAGPWPLRRRGAGGAAPMHRVQVLDGEGDAWVLLHEAGSWFAEGRYE